MSNSSNRLLSGLMESKGALLSLIGPAQEFAATGKKSAAAWSLVKGILSEKLLGPLSMVSGAAIGLLGTIKLVVYQMELLSKGMSKLRQLETIQTQFQPLLGGAVSAKKRLEELYTFAARTPFQLSEVAEASKTLEVLTRGALSTGKGLRMVGDAAGVSGQGLQSVAFWTGRLYDGLKSGRPVGEATNRLQEMGLMSGETRSRIEALAKSGAAFSVIWKEVEKDMERTEGGMARLAETLGGLESTLIDTREMFTAKFADNFLEGEKASVKATTQLFAMMTEPMARVGYWMGLVSNNVQKLKTAFFGLAAGVGQTTGVLSTAVDVFGALMGAIVVKQVLNSAAGFLGLSNAVMTATAALGGNAAALNVQAVSQAWSNAMNTAGVGIMGRLTMAIRATTAALGQMTIAERINTVTTLTLKGAWNALLFTMRKAAAFLGGMIKGIAMAAGGWGAAIAAGAIFLVMLHRMFQGASRVRDAVIEIRKEMKEFTSQVKDADAAMKTFADRAALIDKVKGKISEVKSEIARLEAEEASEDKFSKKTGLLTFKEAGQRITKTDTTELKARKNQLKELQAELMNIYDRDSSTLRQGEARKQQLQEQLEIAREMSKLEFNMRMSLGGEANQVSAMRDRKMYLDKQVADAKRNREAMVLFQDIQEGDETLAARKMREKMSLDVRIRTAEKGLGGEVAANAAQEVRDEIYDSEIKHAMDGMSQLVAAQTGKESRAHQLGSLTKKDLALVQKHGYSEDLGIQATTVHDALGDKVSAERKKNAGPVNGSVLLAAMNMQAMADVMGLHQGERDALDMIIEAEKEKLKAQKQNTAEALRHAEAIKQQQREIRLAIGLLEAEEEKHRGMLGLRNDTIQREQKAAEIEVQAAKTEYAAISKDGKGAARVKDLEEQIDFLAGRGKNLAGLNNSQYAGQVAGLSESERKEWLKKEIAQKKEDLAIAKKLQSDQTQARRKLENAEKKLAGIMESQSKRLEKVMYELQKELSSIKIDEIFAQMTQRGAARNALGTGDLFNEAFDIAAEQENRDIERFRKDKEKEFREAGLDANQIKDATDKAVANRKAGFDAQREQANAAAADNRMTAAFRAAHRAGLIGNKELRQREFDVFAREDLKKQLKLAVAGGGTPQEIEKRKQDAIQRTRDNLDAKILDSLPAQQTVADSLRRIGAGGRAAGNDPMKMLAERRLQAQEAIRKNTATMVDKLDNLDAINRVKMQ